MPVAIEVTDLCKRFTSCRRAPGLRAALRQLFVPQHAEHVAVDGVSFRIERGERVAFVGPNGAGKSTTIKMLTGILFPTSGQASVHGLVPWRDRRRLAYRIGTVFGQRSQLWYHLPAADTFELLGRVYDRDRDAHRTRLRELVGLFELGSELDKPVRELSLGQRMRCEIVASLLHDPDVVFLDEPTIGLDVTAKAAIRDVLREQSRREGKTLLFTSHDTGDMESVCDRVIIIHHGRVLVDQSLAELRRAHLRRKLLTLQTAEVEVEVELAGARVVSREPHRVKLEVDLDRVPVEQVVQHVMARARLHDLTVNDPPMEEVIRALYGRGRLGAALEPGSLPPLEARGAA
ncbi:MAG TPA: ATP-binding cassette domain-containing protein [Polyangiaceae bacterium]|nr:ATP-binding cassette domain-containing protein [Polyangiaceae bacterium]